MASYIAQLEWKLKQERAKNRQLEQRLADIMALDGGMENDGNNGTDEQP